MTVTLPPELEQYVVEKLASGQYQSASDVVQAALRTLQQRDQDAAKLEALRADIAVGIAQLDAGEYGDSFDARKILDEIRAQRSN